MGLATDLCDALANVIRTNHSNMTVQRVTVPTFMSDRLERLTVSVYPTQDVISDATRIHLKHLMTLEIAVQQSVPIDVADTDFVAEMGCLCDELLLLSRVTRLIGETFDAQPRGVRHRPIYSGTILDKDRLFISVIAVDYEILQRRRS